MSNAALTLSALAVLQVRADRRTERVKDPRQVPRVRSEGASGRFRSSGGVGAVEPVPPPPRSAGVATAAVTRWCLRVAFRPARSQPTTPARARISSALGTTTPPQHCSDRVAATRSARAAATGRIMAQRCSGLGAAPGQEISPTLLRARAWPAYQAGVDPTQRRSAKRQPGTTSLVPASPPPTTKAESRRQGISGRPRNRPPGIWSYMVNALPETGAGAGDAP